MTKLGIFVGENGHWSFFREIFADFQLRYQTAMFQPKRYNIPLLYGRLSRWAYDGLSAVEKGRRRAQMRHIAAEKFDIRRTTAALNNVIGSAVSQRVLA